jgi:hypothetical protein
MLAAAEADLEPNVRDWMGKKRPRVGNGRGEIDR